MFLIECFLISMVAHSVAQIFSLRCAWRLHHTWNLWFESKYYLNISSLHHTQLTCGYSTLSIQITSAALRVCFPAADGHVGSVLFGQSCNNLWEDFFFLTQDDNVHVYNKSHDDFSRSLHIIVKQITGKGWSYNSMHSFSVNWYSGLQVHKEIN